MTREEQLVALMRTHQANVWRYLRMLGCEAAQAEDLTQEVFISVLKKPFDDRSRAETAAYLRTVAKHTFLNSIRSQGAKMVVGNLDDADVAWTAVTPEEDHHTRQDALRHCINKLPERAQKAIAYKYGDDFELLKIAEYLDTSEDAVKALLARTRAQLRECIEQKIAGEARP